MVIVSFLETLDCLHRGNSGEYLDFRFLVFLHGRVVGGVEVRVLFVIIVLLLEGAEGVVVLGVCGDSSRAVNVFQQFPLRGTFDVYEVIKVYQLL